MAPRKRRVGEGAAPTTDIEPRKTPGVSPVARNAAAKYDRNNGHSPNGSNRNRSKKRGSGAVTGPGSTPSPFGPRKS